MNIVAHIGKTVFKGMFWIFLALLVLYVLSPAAVAWVGQNSAGMLKTLIAAFTNGLG